MQQEAALTASSATRSADLAAPIYSGLVDPLTQLRRRLGVFTNLRVPKKDPVRLQSSAKLIALPEPQARERALDRNGGTARLENQRSGTVLRGVVESWSHDADYARERGQRTAVFGAERDLLLERRRLTLQSELGLHDADVASDSGSRSLENLGYAFRLSGEEPSGRVSYGVAFDYRGAGFRPDVEVGHELRGRLEGAWRLDDATRLSGYLGGGARELGTDNPYDGWRVGLAMERALLPASVPGLTAELGLEGSRSSAADETADLARTRARIGLRARLAPGLRGRVAVIAENEQEQALGASRQATELRLGLERDFALFGAAARLAGEASWRGRSGSDVASDRAMAGLAFTLSDGADSLSLRGRLVQFDDHLSAEGSRFGGELSSRFQHFGPFYTAGLEAAVRDIPADGEAGSARAGAFFSLPF